MYILHAVISYLFVIFSECCNVDLSIYSPTPSRHVVSWFLDHCLTNTIVLHSLYKTMPALAKQVKTQYCIYC